VVGASDYDLDLAVFGDSYVHNASGRHLQDVPRGLEIATRFSRRWHVAPSLSFLSQCFSPNAVQHRSASG
jgi:hypothetical protein